jgi:hypothetical protein
MRLEEPVHPKTLQQRLTIINVPDLWVVDQVKKIGKHDDHARPIRIPVFPPVPGADWTQELEFGQEIRFFRQNGAEVKKGEKVGKMTLDRYRIHRDNVDIILFVRPDKQVPLRIMMRVGKKAMGIHYNRYLSRGRPKLDYFQEPAGIQWQDAGK